MKRIIGAHMSIAGGYYKAVNAAAELKMDCVQLFTKNNNQWKGKPLSDDDVRLFREAFDRTGIILPCAHDSYLINVASPDDALWVKSRDALLEEVHRAEALGLAGLVMHPGSFTTSSEEEGLDKVVTALDWVHQAAPDVAVQIWLETTAGQGTNLGHRFEHLAYIIDRVREPERLGVCVDTCHIFAAGYPLQTPEEYASTMQEFDKLIGRKKICAFHLNDSLKDRGSRVDRHAHIGEGTLGCEPFRHLLNDPYFSKIPMYMETPKGIRDGVELDEVNLGRLRGLLKTR
ncbi:MAG: deoxyribonuclease IV [Planctomycetota bacterium]|nr:deoxyribonuclease IV [Planctomycetota bacterium]MDA1211549.1 deoxyribonuclease IV [Planctomycetota bacterium]